MKIYWKIKPKIEQKLIKTRLIQSHNIPFIYLKLKVIYVIQQYFYKKSNDWCYHQFKRILSMINYDSWIK